MICLREGARSDGEPSHAVRLLFSERSGAQRRMGAVVAPGLQPRGNTQAFSA
jgi:hypothetical protein